MSTHNKFLWTKENTALDIPVIYKKLCMELSGPISIPKPVEKLCLHIYKQ